MASASQIDANRVNAQASTGPTTDAGKAASAANSTQHGLAGRVIFIEGEDPAIFYDLYARLSADHGPANLTEELLVYKMTEEFWFGRRAAQLLAKALDLNEKQDNAQQVALMLRYQSSADRAFHKALTQLRATQKARLTLGIGFVSQEAGGAPQIAPEPQPLPPSAPAPIGFVSQTPPTLRRESPKVGRNEPCPCGSGLKFKRCCIDGGALHSAKQAA